LKWLAQLHILDEAIRCCSNPPHDLTIPPVRANRPAIGWDEGDDRQLLYAIWRDGVSDQNQMPFKGALTGRVGSLLYAMKWRIIHDEQIGASGPDAAEEGSWSADDLHAVMAALCRIENPTPKNFADQIDAVIRELANCQSPNQDELPEKIPFD
jgi:hypothetical protein